MTVRRTAILLLLLVLLVPYRARCNEAYMNLLAEGGVVIVDGDTLNPAASPLTLEAGPHRLTYLPVQRGRLWKSPLFSVNMYIEHGETLSVNLDGTIDVRVVSSPPGCDVFRGPVRIGRTPLFMSTLEEYPDTLTLMKDYHITTRISLERLSEGETYHVTLLRDGTTAGRLNDTIKSGTSLRSTFLKYGTLAASITTMSLGFWYKNKADDYYEEYLSRGDPEALDRLYRQSIQYDDRARTYWIAGEVTVLLTSYFFLKDFLSSPKRTETETQDRSYHE